MKIWIFNLLVAAALAYLFLGESEQVRVKNDFEWAKEKVEMPNINNRSGEVEEFDSLQSSPRAETESENHGVPVTEQKKTSPVNVRVTELGTSEPGSKLETEQYTVTRDTSVASKALANTQQETLSSRATIATEALEAPRVTEAAETTSAKPKIVRREELPTSGTNPRENAAQDSLLLDDPEIARRRAIVLGVKESETITDERMNTGSMKASERRDALNTLAQDMELMFVDSMAR